MSFKRIIVWIHCIFAIIIVIESETNSTEYVSNNSSVVQPFDPEMDSAINTVQNQKLFENIPKSSFGSKLNANMKPNKCLTTRSKCWSDNQCCSQECHKPMDELPGYCGRDE